MGTIEIHLKGFVYDAQPSIVHQWIYGWSSLDAGHNGDNAGSKQGLMTLKEIDEYKKLLNLRRLNSPREGITVGQTIMIFKKWADGHTEDLNQSARAYLMMSLINAYRWEKM